ncbi:MAG TPA: two-component regulator propeller domain-containing protein [Candidatus Polarisedimenticolia bacterium]|nr:two-component regulator propeller domain-containing protein [Candidatus Polarisedimenticolia bacterium]
MAGLVMRAWRITSAFSVMAAFAPGEAVFALERDRALTQLVLDAWDLEDGLPQISVHAVARTRDGYLWAGTQEGLVRFDGAAFRVHDTSNTPGLGHNSIWALLEDRRGTLWIGTYGGGLAWMRDGEFGTLTMRDGLPGNTIHTLVEDRSGALWVGTDAGGLARVEDGKVTTLAAGQGLPGERVNSVATDASGALWIGTDGGGLVRLQDQRSVVYTSRDGLPDDEVNAVLVDRSGRIWAGTNGGLACLAGGRFTRFTKREGLPHDWVNDVLEDRDGAVWVATTSGVCRMKAGRCEALTAREGLPNDLILTLFEDGDGSIWLGTAGGGLVRLKDGAAASYGPPEGLSYEVMSAILEDRGGTLWVGTYGGGLNRLRDGRWTTFTTEDGLPDDAVTALLEDAGGTLWVGTRRGLCRLDDGVFRALGGQDGSSRAPVRALEEGRDGSLWIGTYGAGVLRLREGRMSRYGRDRGLSHEYVQRILEDAGGVLWVGTDGGGLNRLDGDRFTPVRRAGEQAGNVLSLHEAPGGGLWVGTEGGLCRMEGGRLACFGPREGLFDDIVFEILDDGLGSLWLSCNKGIYRVAQRDLDDLAAGRRATIASVAYGRADGMRSVECNGGVQPAGWRTREGALWFPTVKGAVRLDPRRAAARTPAPALVIEQALVDRRQVDPRREEDLPPGRGDLEFHYAALDLGHPHRVVYRYRLEGFDEDWIAAGPRRAAYYTNVPPGRYRFQVSAARADGAWESAQAGVSFRLRPRFRQTAAFYALCALAVLLAGWAAYLLRVRRFKARQTELRGLVRERTRSLLEANERLEAARQSQADFVSGVSHELKTPLTLIRLYGETLQYGAGVTEEERRSYCEIITHESERLTRLIERVLDFARVDRGEKRYDLQPGDLASVVQRTLDIYGRHLQRQGLQVEAAVEARLPAARFDPDAVADAVLNLLDNAAKYAGEARYVGIRVRSEKDRVVCEVEDRGHGIPPDDREQLFRKFHRGRNAAGKGGYGLGLFLVKHVMDAHGGTIEVDSEPGRGTRFRLVFPAWTASRPAPTGTAAAAPAV